MWIKAPCCQQEEKEEEGRDEERTPRSPRDWEKVCHHYRHSVVLWPSGVTLGLHWALGVWWVTCCHSCHPSISIPFILHPHRKAFCLGVASVCVCRGDHSHALSIATLRPRHPLHSSHTGYGPRLWGVLFPILVRLVQPLVDVSAASPESSSPP